ncbi:phenylacetate--CoA ligase family protein [Antarcticimicrobium luteum]|uniref:Phenylacetate--CoA ligase family protein n=2 Tax=Antarcticimicrobium luteum TaxID=2547397 RepID=A0A4R5UXT0_9RHOB|nr:phenylacetate--CoA ligase family protein [Antarcticimicrobium luteum]
MIEGAERMSRAELAPHIQALWQEQAAYVEAHSDFYHTLWDGRQPPARLEDLAELPLSDKAMLRQSQAAHPPFGDYLASARAAANRLHRTSGTTGQAMNLALSARDAAITQAVGGRCHSAAGLGPEDTVVHCLNYQMWMGGLTDHMTLEATGALVVPFGVGATELLVHTIQEVGITAISCTPSYPAVLERVIAEKFPGLTPRDLGLRLGLFGGEPGLDDPAFRARLRETWGMEPRNANYGVSDVFSNFAAQCEDDSHLHFMAADVLHPELIDPDTAAPLPLEAGQEGELVLTHLLRDCQPLVRFRTGDIIRIEATDPCSCGRSGFRFAVVGRSDDMVVVRGLNMFPSMVAAVVMEFAELSGEYRIELSGLPPYDVLPVAVELAGGVDEAPDLAARVVAEIKRRLGTTAHVMVRAAGSFPRTEGKTKRVIRG